MRAITVAAVLAVGAVLGAPACPADTLRGGDPMLKVPPKVPMKARAFDLKDVRLLDGLFRHAMEMDAKYLLALEADRLLAWFRRDAGLEPKGKVYGGWEVQGLAGHSLGHYLSACSMMYRAMQDDRFRDRVAYIVDELAECQKAGGAGYVAAIPDGKRIFGELLKRDGRMVGWAPWYTVHKLLAGLRDAWLLCGNDKARDVMVRLADWTEAATKVLDDRQMERMLEAEHGGMNEALADVYAITGEQRHLALAKRFCHKAVMDPLSRGEDRLAGLHANTQIPKMTGAARVFELTGEGYYRDAAAFFWETILKNHTYATGGNSDGEHFGPPGRLAERLSPSTTETCNVYNMLKLTRRLFCLDPRVPYADYYERALYNQILASQNPDDGMMCYYLPLRPGLRKTYSTPFDSFWCCVGTGMENHAGYGGAIYYHDETSLYVNLSIASELLWRDKGLKVRQETAFPDPPKTALAMSCARPVKLAVKLRHPAWAAGALEVKLNGSAIPADSRPGGYLTVERDWRDGDRLEVAFPMSLRLEPMPDNPNRVALLYGPIVLAGRLGKTPPAPSDIPVLLTGGRPVTEWVARASETSPAFATHGVGRPRELELIPFYRIHNEHYGVYWDILTPEQWAQRQAEHKAEQERHRELEARTVDMMLFEAQQERGHNVKGEKTAAGQFGGRMWRHATDGGWFSADMKVLPDAPLDLVVTYWGSDAGSREFDILIDGQKIATQRLDRNRPDRFYDEVYPLPEKLTKGKTGATVKFQAHPGKWAGGAFGIRIVRRK